jgi:hypothetical protein
VPKRQVLLVLIGMAAALGMLCTSFLAQRKNIVDRSDPVHWDDRLQRLHSASMLAAKFDTNPKQNEPLQKLIYLNHSKAFEMLLSHDESSSEDFYYYQQGWEAQVNQAHCAVASSAAILNSLRGKISLPQDEVYIPYLWATQYDLLMNECVQHSVGVPIDDNGFPYLYMGIGMAQVKRLLDCHLAEQNYDVEVFHVDPQTMTVDDLREAIKEALDEKEARVIINYDRGGIGQGDMGHGHFSPIGAYNHKLDSFLIMDVAKYKHPAVWVPASRLIGGLATLDPCSDFSYPKEIPDFGQTSYAELVKDIDCQKTFRGFVIVRPSV